MTALEFRGWPKTPRLFRDVTITEKIDGTNAAIIVEEGLYVTDPSAHGALVSFEANGTAYTVGAQSRNRLLSLEADNFGFAQWVATNALTLATRLGGGYHYGEWWGSGIQRGYGLTKGEKRFSLFNVHRYADLVEGAGPALGVVPVLYQGPNSTGFVHNAIDLLRSGGSHAAPGFMRPEGVVVYHSASRSVFKALIENDESPKGAAA